MLIANREWCDKSNEQKDYNDNKNNSLDFILFVGKHIFTDTTFVIFYFSALQVRGFLFHQSRGDGRSRAKPSR